MNSRNRSIAVVFVWFVLLSLMLNKPLFLADPRLETEAFAAMGKS
jgi:hypothetical protein